MEAAYLNVLLKRYHKAATYYRDAAEMYERCNLYDCCQNFKRAIFYYAQEARFDEAIRYEVRVARIYYEDEDWDEASEHFDRAALYCRKTVSLISAIPWTRKVGECLGFVMDYDLAMIEFERIAKDCQTHNLHRYNCNNYLLHAGLMGILFLEEDDNFFDKMDAYIEKLIAIAPDIFPLSKEYKFLQDVLNAYSDMNMDDFADHCYNFDNCTKLNYWLLTMLRRIKRSIELDAGVEPDSESDTEIFLQEGEDHPLRPKFELGATNPDDLDEPKAPDANELVHTEEEQRYKDEEKRVKEALQNAETAEEKAMVLRNAGLLELKKVMEQARKKRKPKPKLEENDDDLNW